MRYIAHHMVPAVVAGLVLANGSMSSNQSGEGEIRRPFMGAREVGRKADRTHCEFSDEDAGRIAAT